DRNAAGQAGSLSQSLKKPAEQGSPFCSAAAAVPQWQLPMSSFSEAPLLRSFENLLDPFPPDEAPTPPRSLASFLWACTRGARRYLVALAILSASVSI